MGPQRMYSLTLWVRRLLVANLLVFLIQKTLLVDPRFLQALGFVPLHALERPWTFVTYLFLHAGVLHLLFNMLMLFIFGPSVEARMGGRMFLLYYLLCGMGGAAFSFLLMQWMPVTLILGASGAILAVTVAFAWYWPNYPLFVFPLPEPIPAKWLVTFLVAFDLVLALAGASDGIAHLAHLGGVATGLLYLKGHDWRVNRREEYLGSASDPGVLVTPASRSGGGGGGGGGPGAAPRRARGRAPTRIPGRMPRSIVYSTRFLRWASRA